MHLIKLLLKIINLFLQRLLAIKLLIILLLGRLRIRRDLRHLCILIDDLLDLLETRLLAVLLKDVIALLVCDREPGRQHGRRLLD